MSKMCNGCEFLNIDEYEQDLSKVMCGDCPPHICKKYNDSRREHRRYDPAPPDTLVSGKNQPHQYSDARCGKPACNNSAALRFDSPDIAGNRR